ncbi:MAG: LPS assembly lipoprotein LptE [Rhodospirillaceae bacterium]
MRGMRWGALGLALLLGACGFRPMMGGDRADGSVASRLATVEIGEIPDRSGQKMRNLLIDRFYHDRRPAAAEYRLEVALEAGEQSLAIEKDASASRAQWTATATYRLVHRPSGKVVLQGSSRAVPGYNVNYYQWGSFVSQQDALDRSIEYVSDEIRTRVALYFARDPDQRPALPAAPARALAP